jgi:hypothetical protein
MIAHLTVFDIVILKRVQRFRVQRFGASRFELRPHRQGSEVQMLKVAATVTLIAWLWQVGRCPNADAGFWNKKSRNLEPLNL